MRQKKPMPKDLAIMRAVEPHGILDPITCKKIFYKIQPEWYPDWDPKIDPCMEKVVMGDIYNRICKIRKRDWMPIYMAPKRKGYLVIKNPSDWGRVRPGYHKPIRSQLLTFRKILYKELQNTVDIREKMKIKEEIARVEVALESRNPGESPV